MLLVRLIWRDSTHTTHRLSLESCLELISEIGIGFVGQWTTLLSSCAITLNPLRHPHYKQYLNPVMNTEHDHRAIEPRVN